MQCTSVLVVKLRGIAKSKQVHLFMNTACVLVYMSVLVCMCNEPAHPHIYIQALTVHLFVSVTAPWWLLFSPSWGGEGEVMCWGSLAGKCVAGRRPIPQ